MTTAPEHTIDTDQVAGLVRAWRSLEQKRLDIVDEQVEVKAQIRKLLEVGDTLDVDGKAIRCQPNRRFDVDRGVALLESAIRDICRTESYDPAKVKQHLTPALLSACMVEQGEPKLTLA
jgi:hypothetical protein